MGNLFNNQFPTNMFGVQQNNACVRVPQRQQTATAPSNSANRGYRVPTRAPAAAAPAGVQSPAPAAAALAGVQSPAPAAAAPAGVQSPAPRATAPAKMQSPAPRATAPAKMQSPATAGDTLLQGNILSGVPANIKAASSDKGKGLSSDNTNSYKTNYSEDSLKLYFSEENLLKGLIMSEILGKPKCLRRGRW